MAGNVYEWVKDWYSETFYSTPNASTQNPTGPVSGNNRILRGGSWLTGFNATRTTARKSFDPGASNMTGVFAARVRHNRIIKTKKGSIWFQMKTVIDPFLFLTNNVIFNVSFPQRHVSITPF
jgi:hypothetical protein